MIVSSRTLWCLESDLPCPSNPNRKAFCYHNYVQLPFIVSLLMIITFVDYSVFINCGGPKVLFEGNEYEENAIDAGPSHFESNDRWAFSSTGIYIGNDRGGFVAQNDTPMSLPSAEIYETARVSPSSLKFYGLCLRRGSYKVRLHFAEIMFSDDSNFTSLGRRIFDVTIQVTRSMHNSSLNVCSFT